jgi:hypothetical protein
MVNDLVKLEHRGTYQAYVNLLYGGGAAAGAASGGFLCQALGWRWTFAGQIPLILVVYVMAYFCIPSGLGPSTYGSKSLTQQIREFDIPGSFFLFVSVACLILGLNLGGNIYAWSDPIVIGSLLLSVVTGLILIRIEQNAIRPILPLELLTEAPRSNLLFANLFVMCGSNHILFNAPIFFEVVYGDSPTTAGLRMSLPAVFTTVFGVATGFFLTWSGRLKAPQVVGSVVMLLGGVMVSMLWKSSPQWLATISVIPGQAGQGFVFPATVLGLLATSSQSEQAVVMTTMILFRNLGIILGVAISSLILQNALYAYLELLVTGPEKQEIIEKVRMSVQAVMELTGEHKQQAIAAYASALKLTFVAGLVFFIIVAFLIIPVKLPRLGKQKDTAEEDEV